MKKLNIRIRQLDDGRFYIRYYWRWWEVMHTGYFENAEEASQFLKKLVENTKWQN